MKFAYLRVRRLSPDLPDAAAREEPFRLAVTHAIIDADQTLSGGVDVGIGGAWFEATSTRNSFRTDAVCLGSHRRKLPCNLVLEGNTNAFYLRCGVVVGVMHDGESELPRRVHGM